MIAPVTTLYASLLGLLLVFLSWQVSANRRRARVSLGAGDDPALERAARAQGNFVEYVPVALLLLFLLEQEVTSLWLLHVLGSMLLLGRIVHAWGLLQPGSVNRGRWWGTVLTWSMIVGSSTLNLWHLV
ncbi:MAG: MAPEG family protein [Xanthomonadales bacterium]|nr:MAPEG family protein [Xanthomonadales bacterium]